METANPTEPHGTVLEENNPIPSARKREAGKLGDLPGNPVAEMRSCPQISWKQRSEHEPRDTLPLLPAKPRAPSSSQHWNRFRPRRGSQLTKQEPRGIRGIRRSELCPSATLLWWVSLGRILSPRAASEPPLLAASAATSPGRSPRCALELNTIKTFVGLLWTLGKQEFHQAIKVVLKSFPDFIIFHRVCNSPSWLFEKWHTAVPWISAGPPGSRRRRPGPRPGPRPHPEPPGFALQTRGTRPPHHTTWYSTTGSCHITALLNPLNSCFVLLSRIKVKKWTNAWKEMGEKREKARWALHRSSPFKAVFFLVFFTFCFVIFGLFWSYPGS